jgi:carbonic anhydrase
VAEIDRLLEQNRAFAEEFSAGGLPGPPARAVVVVTCMDARVDPAALLGLAPGDAHVLRNAGGVVTEDTLRSLTISQHSLGTREVLLVHHTRCGMQGLDAAAFAATVEESTGARPPWDPRGFADAEDDVRESVRLVRECPWLLSHEVRGAVYDVDTGLLREIR